MIAQDQMACCLHRYEREEPFLSLGVSVGPKALKDSLKELVKGEWLQGDNAYYCEKCKEKVDMTSTCMHLYLLFYA